LTPAQLLPPSCRISPTIPNLENLPSGRRAYDALDGAEAAFRVMQSASLIACASDVMLSLKVEARRDSTCACRRPSFGCSELQKTRHNTLNAAGLTLARDYPSLEILTRRLLWAWYSSNDLLFSTSRVPRNQNDEYLPTTLPTVSRSWSGGFPPMRIIY